MFLARKTMKEQILGRVFFSYDLSGSFLTNDDMNNWIHFAVTYDGTDVKLYINGSLVREKTLTVARQNTGLGSF